MQEHFQKNIFYLHNETFLSGLDIQKKNFYNNNFVGNNFHSSGIDWIVKMSLGQRFKKKSGLNAINHIGKSV